MSTQASHSSLKAQHNCLALSAVCRWSPGPRICTSFTSSTGEVGEAGRNAAPHMPLCGADKISARHSFCCWRALSVLSAAGELKHSFLCGWISEPGMALSLSGVRASSCGLNWQRSNCLAARETMAVLGFGPWPTHFSGRTDALTDSHSALIGFCLQFQSISSLIVLNSSV